MNRSDLSPSLVHWTKGSCFEEALESLISICIDEQIFGGTRGIADGSRCVCFTESPVDKFHEKVIGEFKPFGIQVTKEWLFGLGGRPVIYQPRYDLKKLDPSIRWRHVDFSLKNNSYRRNYTWQREWRIQRDSLWLPEQTVIVVPTREYGNRLIQAFDSEDSWRGCQENIDLGYFYTYNPVQARHYQVLYLDEI